MREQRRHERYPIIVEVEVTLPGLFWKQRRRFHTRDMSDGGVFLEADGKVLPPPGTAITVQVVSSADGETNPVVPARVVRVLSDGMAVTFVKSGS